VNDSSLLHTWIGHSFTYLTVSHFPDQPGQANNCIQVSINAITPEEKTERIHILSKFPSSSEGPPSAAQEDTKGLIEMMQDLIARQDKLAKEHKKMDEQLNSTKADMGSLKIGVHSLTGVVNL